MSKDNVDPAVWEQASKETLLVSDSLKDRLDISTFNEEWEIKSTPGGLVNCTLYYEAPSEGIRGEFIRIKREAGTFLVGVVVDHESIGECLVCPQFTRMIVTIGGKMVYEMDFDDPWREQSREILSQDGRIELYISLRECDT